MHNFSPPVTALIQFHLFINYEEEYLQYTTHSSVSLSAASSFLVTKFDHTLSLQNKRSVPPLTNHGTKHPCHVKIVGATELTGP